MELEKTISRENGMIKAKITKDHFGVELLTSRNGWQWVGQKITPELARLTIEVLQEYLDNS